MYKVIIWGTGTFYNQYLNHIKYQELLNTIEVQAITSNETTLSTLDSYKFIPKSEIKHIEFDYCLVAFDNFKAALNEARLLNIPDGKLIPLRVFSIPLFDFN
jgi:hypothetical protein